MGWSSGDEVFDPVCTTIVNGVVTGQMEVDFATEVLIKLIRGLQDRGWDTEDESLGEFRDREFVVAAFKAQGVELSSEDDQEEPQ